VITTPLGMFLIAERMSILSGRDDEFVMIMTGYWHALRLGELVGLEREYVTAAAVDVQWQLHHLDVGDNPELRAEAPGGLLRCQPKDGSVGLVASPPFMAAMLADYMTGHPRKPCECHGKAYVFDGFGARPRPRGAITVGDLAGKAGVTRSDVSSVINRTRAVSAAKRAAVEKVIAETGYTPPPKPGGTSRHWRSADFERMFSAAASGLLKARDGFPERPVPLAGEWPGIRLKGRNAEGRAEWCWLPVAKGMTPHGWRHAAKTLMEEHRVPEVASETRLRHLIAGVSGTYRQVTASMEEHMLGVLQEQWEAALDARLALSPSSTVGIAGKLLRERAEARKLHPVPRNSPEGAEAVALWPSRTRDDLRIRRSR
jgi:integrase